MSRAVIAGVLVGVLRDLVEFALPQRCPGCAAEADARRLLCDRCWERIPKLAIALCVRCLAEEREPAGCTRHPGFAVWPAWIYDERAALLVQALKFQERVGVAGALAEAMAAALPPASRPDLVIPVPLHPARRRERGYNQAALLAHALARRLGSPVLEAGLERLRATRAQVGLGPGERRRQLAGAFRVTDQAALKDRTVLVVDDVVTTGSTLVACLEPLRRAGAHASAATLAWAQ